MFGLKGVATLAVAAVLGHKAAAKAVFAHYMVSGRIWPIVIILH